MIDIRDKQNCCGCWACVQICPKKCILMSEDKEGFLYPQVNVLDCINCGLCEKVCPVLIQRSEKNPILVYAAKNNDERIRVESSSGGIFTLLAEEIIANGGVVFGAKFDENWDVVHDCSRTVDHLSAFRGSKYVQSRIECTYKAAEEFLKKKYKVLFSGTPCQISGLKLFLRKEYDNLVTIDFICHGVPSPGVWRRYLTEEFGGTTKALPISGISFRDKQRGWERYSFVVRGQAIDDAGENTVLRSDYHWDNSFMKAFLSDLILRPSCHACPTKSGKSGSDITLADYWGIQNVFPDFNDDKGVSAVLINTAKGQQMLEHLNFEKRASSYDKLVKYNQSIVKSATRTRFRDDFMRSFLLNRKVADTSIFLSKKMKPSIVKRAVLKLNRILSR